MRILVVSFYYEPEIGAAPGRITNMAKGLKDLGFDIDVLTCLPNYPKGRIFEGYRHRFSVKEQIYGINVYRYWAYATVSKNAFKRVFAMATSAMSMFAFAFRFKLIRSYDKVIVQSPPIMVSASAVFLFKKLFKRNIVLNVSDLWPGAAVELGFMKSGGIAFRFMSGLERFIYKNADSIMGQSQEILDRIKELQPEKPMFLYRNLPMAIPCEPVSRDRLRSHEVLRIVYAGLLGVPQDVLSIIRNINFKELGCEFHIYGGGNQTEEIIRLIGSGVDGVYYHGLLKKEDMISELSLYDVSLVSLVKSIRGALPSKIFDILPFGMPILFSGDGEGGRIVSENEIGLVSGPSDYNGLKDNIIKFIRMNADTFRAYTDRCLVLANGRFNFIKQMNSFKAFLGTEL